LKKDSVPVGINVFDELKAKKIKDKHIN